MCSHGRVPLEAPGGVPAWKEYVKESDNEPATTKQINYIKRLDSSQDLKGLTKKSASKIIEKLKGK